VHPMAMDQLEEKYNRCNRLPFVDNKLRLHCRQNKDRLLPSGVIYELSKKTTRIFCTFQQSNKAATYDSRVASSQRNPNAMIEIYREGKTPGSVLCGLVYAYMCALLVVIRVYDAKKILVNALGTLRTTGTRSLKVLNAAKEWV
jgi:hypothetical protein